MSPAEREHKEVAKSAPFSTEEAPNDTPAPDSVRWFSDGRPEENATEYSIPERIGPYPVVARLGRGGMGEVFLARDVGLDRQIALKRVRRDRSGADELARRFESEARVTARLQHPAVIPVYHFEGGDDAFYTMRPVEGMTLAALISNLRKDEGLREEWPTARIVRLFLQAANAVAYAHSRGVVHRDLKPANIILGPFEEVLVLDWGLARVLPVRAEEIQAEVTSPPQPDATAQTPALGLIGTPPYMAPELFAGDPADELTDLFALGVTLYELLAWKRPWPKGISRPSTATKRAQPNPPGSLRSDRRVPRRLFRVITRAMSYDRSERYPNVATFVHEIAQALEGRAIWRSVAAGQDATLWRFAGGQRRLEEEGMTLSSRGERLPFRLFHTHRLGRNVRLEFDLRLRRGAHELTVWLGAEIGARGEIESGYALAVAARRQRVLSLLRSGRDVAGGAAPDVEPRRWHHVVAKREDDRLSLQVDGEEVYAYTDVAPLGAGFVGLTGRSEGLQVRNIFLFERGSDVRVSCLAVPDAFYYRGLFEAARAEYEAIAATHSDRVEGELARFRGGRCMLELYARESDPAIRSLLLDEALSVFTDDGRSLGSALAELGRAMVAGERGRPDQKHEALSRALAAYPDDPHRHVVVEWLLGRLHAVEPVKRATIAELLPLAIDHGMEHWGRRVVSDLIRMVRSSWETPAFMSARGSFRENDRSSRAEARMYFAFWAGRPKLVQKTVEQLIALGDLAPHHVTDGIAALLELDNADLARTLLEGIESAASSKSDPRLVRAMRLARVSTLAASGEIHEAAELLARVDLDAADRAANATRLTLARAAFDRGEVARALAALEPLGNRDYFAREHLAWFYLLLGEPNAASQQLAPLVDRKDHHLGRNLTNFLFGATLLARGSIAEAQAVFWLLPASPHPRTWTLGSHWSAGRLQDDYLRGAFPWEICCLDAHRRLLSKVGCDQPLASSVARATLVGHGGRGRISSVER